MKGASLLLLTFLPGMLNAQWQVMEVAPMPIPTANNAVCAGEVNGSWYVYSFGGIGSGLGVSDIHQHCYRYDLSNDLWTTLPDLPDTLGKVAAAANVIDGVAYVIGGYHVFNGPPYELSSDRVHRFDLTTNTWLPDGAPLPMPIDDHVQAVWRDSLIVVVTGWRNTTNVPDVVVFDPALDAWSTASAVPNTNAYKAFGAAGTFVGDTLYYLGGASTGINFPAQVKLRRGVVDATDPTAFAWSLENDQASPAYRPASFTHGGRAYWVGGSTVSYNYDAIAYNGSGVVAPSNLLRSFDPSSGMSTEEPIAVPAMDQRGIGDPGDGRLVLAGGIGQGAQVSAGTYIIQAGAAAIQELAEPAIVIHPNPVVDVLHVMVPWAGNTQYRVLDAFGRVLGQGTFNGPEGHVGPGPIASGCHVLQLFHDGRVHRVRFWSINDR